MKELMKATAYRIMKTTSARICLLLCTLSAVGYFVLSKLLAEGNLAQTSAGSVTALGDAMIIWLFGSLMVGIIVCQDFTSKAIHSMIGASGDRKKIIFNYAAIISLTILLLALPYTICSLVSMLCGADYTGAESAVISVYLDNLKYGIQDISVIKLLLLYISTAIVYVGSISVCLPIAIKVRKPVVITAIGFMFGMMVALLNTAIADIEILQTILKATPFAYNLTNLNLESSYLQICGAMLASVSFTALMAGLAYLLFRRDDVK